MPAQTSCVVPQRPPRDEDLTFSMQLFRDYPDARRSLAALRKIYPNAKVILVSDGDPDPRYAKLAEQHNARFVAGERLYPTRFGGQMLHRNFELFLENPTAYWFKIDPDTRCHRRLNELPQTDGLFGTLRFDRCDDEAPRYPIVQGGFVGASQATVRRIVESGILMDPALRDFAATYAVNPHVRCRAENKGIISTDYVLRYACLKLNLPAIAFDEVHSVTEADGVKLDTSRAFTHPHKSLHVTVQRALHHRGRLGNRVVNRVSNVAKRQRKKAMAVIKSSVVPKPSTSNTSTPKTSKAPKAPAAAPKVHLANKDIVFPPGAIPVTVARQSVSTHLASSARAKSQQMAHFTAIHGPMAVMFI